MPAPKHSRFNSIRVGSIKSTQGFGFSGDVAVGGALSVTGAAEFSSTAAFAGVAAFGVGTTFAGSATVLTAGSFSIRTTIPTTITSAGAPGQLAVTQNANTTTIGYLFVCVATNSWIRLLNATSQVAFN